MLITAADDITAPFESGEDFFAHHQPALSTSFFTQCRGPYTHCRCFISHITRLVCIIAIAIFIPRRVLTHQCKYSSHHCSRYVHHCMHSPDSAGAIVDCNELLAHYPQLLQAVRVLRVYDISDVLRDTPIPCVRAKQPGFSGFWL